VVARGYDDAVLEREPLVVVVGGEFDVEDRHGQIVAVALAVVEETVSAQSALLRPRDRAGEAQIGTEVDGEPAVPPDVLPVARPPRVVTEAETVCDVERVGADVDGSRDRHVLLGVPAREHLLGIEVGFALALFPLGLAAPRCSDGFQEKVDPAVDVRVVLESRLRLGHLPRTVQDADLPVVGDAVLLVRLDDLEAEPAGVVCVVGRDVRTLEHEADASVRQIQAHGELGVALVYAVAHAHPAARADAVVEPVVVAAFVEVGHVLRCVHVIVFGGPSHPHGCLLRMARRRVS
jgi:hypothetical protein